MNEYRPHALARVGTRVIAVCPGPHGPSRSRPNPDAPLANPVSQKPVALGARVRSGNSFPTRTATTVLLWTGTMSSRCGIGSAQWAAGEQRQEELQLTKHIESRALKWSWQLRTPGLGLLSAAWG